MIENNLKFLLSRIAKQYKHFAILNSKFFLAVKNSGWVQAWWQGKCVTLDVSWMMAWLGARCLPGREDHYTVRIISEKGEQ